MSAALSGFVLPLTVVPPNEGDLQGFEVGRRLLYIRKFCGAKRRLSEWIITKVDDNFVYVQPLQFRHFLDPRRFTREQLLYHFQIQPRKICE